MTSLSCRLCRPALSTFVVIALLAAGCGDSPDQAAEPEPTSSEPADDPGSSEDAAADDAEDPGADSGIVTRTDTSFDVRVSAGQVTVTAADPGAVLELGNGPNAYEGVADESGNLIFRLVEPAAGYVLSTSDGQTTGAFDVPGLDDHPDQSFYDGQTLAEGLNYIEMRDGTLIAAMVRFPDGVGDGPFPTVIEYSGYDPASPYEEEPTIQIYRALGYATVGVNMRGSGCSGGAYDFFEPLQSIDGYDVVEAIAAQDWVQHNHVGMVGISYSGISQLFVAATQPPSLAAITPLSVIEDTYRSVLYPGGIYNNGFAKSWADARQGANEAFGQEWVTRRVEEGDKICEDNQLLRSQNRDLDELTAANAYYDPATADPLSPRTFVGRISVPVFVAGAWQDEQTGGRFATMLDDFDNAPLVLADLYNGAHADSLGPYSLHRAAEFLDVYVARRTPGVNPLIRLGAPLLYEAVFGVPGIGVPEDRFASLAEAESAIESEPPLRLLLDMGSAPDLLGAPWPRNVMSFDRWVSSVHVADMAPGGELVNWVLQPRGRLAAWDADADPDGAGLETAVEAFTVSTERSQLLTKTADGDGDPNEFDNLHWPALAAGEALVYETAPFSDDRLLLGSGVVSLAVAADAADADLQATISEIRPDGQEMYVQTGWLRVSHRALGYPADAATLHTHASSDAAPIPEGELVDALVEIFPAAHVFRAGSKLRLTIDSPGGNRNLWAFDVVGNDGTDVLVQLGGDADATAPSTLTLPMFDPPADLDPALPVCGSQRSQPCRPAVSWTNRVG